MRKLMWFTIGFAISCGLCVWYLPGSRISVFGIAALICFFLSAALSFPIQKLRPLAAVFLGGCIGFGWFSFFQHAYLDAAIAMDAKEQFCEITASDFGYDTAYGSAVDGRIQLEGRSYRARIYLDGDVQIEPGDRIQGKFSFRVTTPDGEKGGTYHSGNGIFLLLYQEDEISYIPAASLSWREYPAVIRNNVAAILKASIPDDVLAFSKALLLGDTFDLSYEIDTVLKISGIRHVVAVSGLHISMLYGLIRILTGRKRFLTALIGIPVLAVFAAVIGFTPSVTRSCIMVGLMMVAAVLDKEYDGPTELAAACLVMLLRNPLSITSVSLQLSAGCIAGMQLFSGRLNEWLKGQFPASRGIYGKLINWFCGSISATLGAMSLTVPLSACYFGTVSLAGIVTNLVTLWLITIVFLGLVVLCVLFMTLPSGAVFLGGLLAWPIRFVLFAAEMIAAFPLAAVYTCSIYISAWLIFVYILLAVFLLQRKRSPGVFVFCITMGLCAALLFSWLEPRMDDVRLTVFDVGQGQSILLQSKDTAILVDCGGDDGEAVADLVSQSLLSQGITRLDALILTHNDDDHSNGAAFLLSRIPADKVIMRKDGREADVVAAAKGQVIHPLEDMQIHLAGVDVTVYGPDFLRNGGVSDLCVLFDTEKCDILITGDRNEQGEEMLLNRLPREELDVLIVGHHGSRYSTSEALLHQLRPDTAVLSVGAGNRHGHPAPETIRRLQKYGCQILRTDTDGTVLIRR